MHKKLQKLKDNIAQLSPFIAPYKWGFWGAVLMGIISIAAMTTAPRIEGMITTQLAKDASDLMQKLPGAGVHFKTVLHILAVLAVIYLVKTLAQAASAIMLTNSIQNAMHDMRNAVQDKVRRLPVRYFDSNSFGDVLSRITNDIDTISNALQQSFMQIINGILTLILAIVMMFTIQPVMACMALVIIPLSLLITRFIIKKSQKQFNAQQNSMGELNGAITEMYTGFREILLFNRQADSVREFEEINDRLRKHAFSAQFLSSMLSPLISLVTYLTIGAIAVTGALFALSGVITIGNLQAFIRYVWQINDPLSQVSQLSAQIQAAFAAMDRVFGILREEEEVKEADPPVILEKAEGNVTFDHVSFGYRERPVIQDFTIEVKKGQMVAIVGPTGAGKTTLINLLMRFYDVNKCSIRIDGVDIRDMKRRDLRNIFGMVLQDTWLFSGSIFDNIRYGRLDARKDEVIDAAKAANIHHFIRTLPGGYDMVIDEEGSNISQGEKQLLTIARAILKDPDILILDEATSSVDTRIERILQDAMQRLMEGRTSFVIAHRLSTIKNADMILVIRDGNIVEQGTHASLLAAHGFYEQLYNSQFAGKQI
ncbi:ATP-binding cassette domain-containing protein [Lactonifactor sp. BIOML-A3]|uniref:ABC transporter ATP-binding protein n=1 Tax=unclassified Lactonifactor TaxID=2636670 RepID=UPI0012B0B14C|nr:MULTISPECIES: ABC transporter ATP-binding protein [unclassified Lactonifactor]MSA01155.1 ATP-binding cassette domain-containing protein [Lactonifactor sp. BIOML-A5]MSA09805.1 ATP-binding cassette domain-containing protein [Lactonifactor sp. BIOML-A4]MSA14407.1 ATP-binding cassette domain-containing protein [Lactonifactor sp. BIOML-A3]MSA18810.1 ATP-binding cassette domain-containing protein [Lactonifactor sp. BIOML-A2]MSA39595.1 ATP-binding cassette domain-containing protein [Lactonifactor 